LARERWLCDVEVLGRSAEMLLFADGNKITQMAQFHINTQEASKL
jgi:hypothetical protein